MFCEKDDEYLIDPKEGKYHEKLLGNITCCALFSDKRKHKNGVWIMFPTWGDVGPDLDFQILTRYDSFVGLGEAWDIYAPGTEAHTAIEEATGGLFSSVVTRVSFPTVLRYMSDN